MCSLGSLSCSSVTDTNVTLRQLEQLEAAHFLKFLSILLSVEFCLVRTDSTRETSSLRVQRVEHYSNLLKIHTHTNTHVDQHKDENSSPSSRNTQSSRWPHIIWFSHGNHSPHWVSGFLFFCLAIFVYCLLVVKPCHTVNVVQHLHTSHRQTKTFSLLLCSLIPLSSASSF